MTDDDWIQLWHDTGHHLFCQRNRCDLSGQRHELYDAASDWAIEQLMNAGHTLPSPDNEKTQAFLILAALHSPTLIR